MTGPANGTMPGGTNAIRCAVVSAVHVGTHAQLLVRTPASDALTLPTGADALPK